MIKSESSIRRAAGAGFILAVVVLLATFGIARAQQCPPNCDGTGGSDEIFGNGNGNNIDAKGGDDFVDGSGGNDDLLGGPGDDLVLGGPDNDEVKGEVGSDNNGTFSQDGLTFKLDALVGEGGNDQVNGGDGGDGLDGDAGRDDLNGGLDNDTLYAASNDNDVDDLDAGAGEDICVRSFYNENDSFVHCEHMFRANP